MTPLKRILLVEDSSRDAELILDALSGHQLANEVVHVRDGADALDYLYRRGQFADRSDQDFIEAVRQVGAFWGVINEVPPGSVKHDLRVGS